MENKLILPHGGYRKLVSFQIARLVFDITVRFCDKFINKYSRTNDQMIQAARSGVQNIAEGSMASATSRKTELKLTNVAKSSLEELKLDYEDFLRQNSFKEWSVNDPIRKKFISNRFQTADEFVVWVRKCQLEQMCELSEIAANGAIQLITVACRLLGNQIEAQAKTFQNEGGFTERLYHNGKSPYRSGGVSRSSKSE